MAKYITNQGEVVNAMRFDGNFDHVAEWVANWHPSEDTGPGMWMDGAALIIDSGANEQRADIGDWIVRTDDDEFYVCPPGAFAALYRKG